MQDLILWIHALAALLFTVLATAQARPGASALPGGRFAAALALTALWSLAVAGIGFGDVVTRLTESLRQLGWLALMTALAWHGGTRPGRPIVALYVVVCGVLVLTLSLAAAAATWEQVSVDAKRSTAPVSCCA